MKIYTAYPKAKSLKSEERKAFTKSCVGNP